MKKRLVAIDIFRFNQRHGEYMFIKTIKIRNFGVIDDINFSLSPQKVNLIIGGNATGKTTFLSALFALFYDDKILSYPSVDHIPYEIAVTINDKSTDIEIKQSIANKKPVIQLENFNGIKSVNRFQDLLFLLTGEGLHQVKHISSYDIEKARNFIRKYDYNSPLISEFDKLGISEHEKPSFFYLSGGSKIIINLICMISNMPFNSVLVGDAIFSGIDHQISAKLLDFLDKVDGVQFVFLENFDVAENSNRSVIKHYLKAASKQQNRLYFSNDLYDILRNRSYSLMQDYSISNNAIELKNYYLGEKVDIKEGRDYEFKEILGKNPCESIIKNVDIYINAFLNSTRVEKGVILFGVSDPDRIVKGVKLNYEQQDIIKRRISEDTAKIEPHISMDSYYIEFKEVHTQERMLEDLYIVEITVHNQNSKYLYSNSKADVFIKTEGGKVKLSPLKIQEEFEFRLRNRSS